MTPLNVGMFAMIAAGLGGMAVALMVFSKKTSDGIRRPLATSCVAVLLLGVGTFGPSFMEPYTKLLGVLMGTDGSEKDEPAYAKSFDDIGAGVTDGKSAGVQLFHALDHPVPNMDTLLDKSIAKATSEAGKQRLLAARAALGVKEEEAKRLVDQATPQPATGAPPKPVNLKLQDPGVRRLMEQRIAKKPAAEIDRLKIDDATKAILLKPPPVVKPR